MLVDGGATVNLVPYTIYKNIEKADDELTKANMMLHAFTGDSTGAKGVLIAELTIGRKTLLTTFFMVDVQGNYSVLMRRSLYCIPSMLHQMLNRWKEQELDIVLADSSSHIALASADANWQHEKARCLSCKSLEACDYL